MSNTVLDTWRATFLHSMPAPVTCLALRKGGSCPYVIVGRGPHLHWLLVGVGFLRYPEKMSFLRLSLEDEIL